MGGGIAIKPFHLQRDNQKPRHLLIAIAHFLQTRFAFNRLRKCDGLGWIIRNEGGDLIHLPIRHTQHAPHIAHRGLGLQLAEGDDLRDAIFAIFAPDIGNHLVAPVLAEINIEIRHGNAFGVEEAFKQQAEADGVQIRDQQRPGSDRTRARTAPWPHWNGRRLRLGPLDEIGNNQEVTWETHLLDDANFIGQAFAILRARCFIRRGAHGIQALFQPGFGHGAECLSFRLAFLHLGADRQFGLARFGHHRAHARNGERIVAGIGQIREKRAHGFRRFEPMLRCHAPAVAFRHGAAFSDAQQRIMRFIHGRGSEIDIIGGNDRQPRGMGKCEQGWFQPRFLIPSMTVEFHRQPIREGFLQAREQLFGGGFLAFQQQA